MLLYRRLSILLVVLAALGGCASTPHHDDSYVFVGERVYKDATLDYMFTMAQRTMRDMHITRSTVSKNESSAFLVVLVPETEFGEMAMEIRPVDAHATKVTMFSHDRHDQEAATHILDDMGEQIAIDKDPLHAKKH